MPTSSKTSIQNFLSNTTDRLTKKITLLPWQR